MIVLAQDIGSPQVQEVLLFPLVIMLKDPQVLIVKQVCYVITLKTRELKYLMALTGLVLQVVLSGISRNDAEAILLENVLILG